jgi:DNA-binding NarL/FixJ family response regulator
MHAEGADQVVNRTAKINFMARRPASPLWQDGAPRVAVVRGAKGLGALDTVLGKRFVVRRVADASLYDVVDTSYRTAAAVVVVDLGTVPAYTLSELHALLPEVKIVGLTATPAKSAYYRSIGVSAILPRKASPARVAHAVKSLVR